MGERVVAKGQKLLASENPSRVLWSWRKLLKFHGIAKQFILFKVGNGENIFLRLDYWHLDSMM
jgi:hypothetical protein